MKRTKKIFDARTPALTPDPPIMVYPDDCPTLVLVIGQLKTEIEALQFASRMLLAENVDLKRKVATDGQFIGRMKAAMATCGAPLKPTQTRVPFRKGGRARWRKQ